VFLPTQELVQFDIYQPSYVRRESLCRVTLREWLGGAPPLFEDGKPVAGRFLIRVGLWVGLSELALMDRFMIYLSGTQSQHLWLQIRGSQNIIILTDLTLWWPINGPAVALWTLTGR
jgi:hypothetical protein